MTCIRQAGCAAATGAVVALMVTACSLNADPSADSVQGCDPITVGVTVYGTSSFVSQCKEGTEAYAEARDIALLWESAGGDPTTHEALVMQFIDADVDAIVIVPALADLLAVVLHAAQAAGIEMMGLLGRGLHNSLGFAQPTGRGF